MIHGLEATRLWICRCSLRPYTRGSASRLCAGALTALSSAGFLGRFSGPILMSSLRNPVCHLPEPSVNGLGPIQHPEAAVSGGPLGTCLLVSSFLTRSWVCQEQDSAFLSPIPSLFQVSFARRLQTASFLPQIPQKAQRWSLGTLGAHRLI